MTATSTTVMTSLAQPRGRPGTTSEYAMPIRQAARIATGKDGIEKPIQSPMIVTPYGRGRLVSSRTPVPMSPSAVR